MLSYFSSGITSSSSYADLESNDVKIGSKAQPFSSKDRSKSPVKDKNVDRHVLDKDTVREMMKALNDGCDVDEEEIELMMSEADPHGNGEFNIQDLLRRIHAVDNEKVKHGDI